MDYRKNYIKIYFWQTISVLLGFAALFVVVPYISSNKIVYGIYSVCTSLTIFFSYADLGFLSSGVKYAAEYYVRGEHREEMRIIGFTSFIMVSVFAILALGIVVLGVFPKLLIPELAAGSEQMSIARWLLFTLAISCPVIIGQRLMNLVFSIRVEDYKYQRMNIIGNVIRILSVLFFFGGGRYMIVEYFIFYQFVNFAVVVSALLYARKHYGYGIKEFLRTFYFDREIFNKVKGLTGASLIMMISSVVYYEFDQVVISNLIGIEAVATYAVALSALQLVRTFCAIIYSPYTSRFNHFAGLNDYSGLTSFVNKMITLFAPIIIVPILTLSILATPFVISWVGEQYRESGILVSFLVLSFVYNYFREPINQYFVATENYSVLVKYNIITPIVFWLGIMIMMSFWETKAFAIMKFIAPAFGAISYLFLANNDFCRRGYHFISIWLFLKTLLIPIVLTVVFSFLFSHWMIEEFSRQALLLNIFILVCSVLASIILTIPFNDVLKSEVLLYTNKWKNMIKNEV